MKAHSPAFQFYPKDWLSDGLVREMSAAQKGIYIDLLAIYWLEDGLPADPERLARLVGVPIGLFRRLWPGIERCFQTENSRLVQRRLDDEKRKQLEYRLGQSEKGRKSAKSRGFKLKVEPRLKSGSTKSEVSVSVSVNGLTDSTPPRDDVSGESQAIDPGSHISGSVARKEPEKKSWTREAAEDWDARFGLGSSHPSKIGRQLSKIVKAHGWDEVRPPWRRYLVERDPTFVSPSDFAGKFKAWLEGSTGADDLEAHNRREAAKAIQRDRSRAQPARDVTPARKGLPAHDGFSRVLPPKE